MTITSDVTTINFGLNGQDSVQERLSYSSDVPLLNKKHRSDRVGMDPTLTGVGHSHSKRGQIP